VALAEAVKGQQVQQAQTSVRDLQAADAVLQGLTLIIPRYAATGAPLDKKCIQSSGQWRAPQYAAAVA
jgi:hypothetical protein